MILCDAVITVGKLD